MVVRADHAGWRQGIPLRRLVDGQLLFRVHPVSFDRTIEIYTQGRSTGSDIDLCTTATAFAEATVTKLANPDSLQADHTVLPLSQWDGCSMLAAALGNEVGRYALKLTEGVPGLDGCDASTGSDLELSLELTCSWDPASNRGEPQTDRRPDGRRHQPGKRRVVPRELSSGVEQRPRQRHPAVH